MEVFARIRRAGAGAAAAGRRRAGTRHRPSAGARARGRARSSMRSASRRRCSRCCRSPIVFLLPSAQESFGLAALEAMACDVPVVASRRRRAAGSDRARRHRIPSSARTTSTAWRRVGLRSCPIRRCTNASARPLAHASATISARTGSCRCTRRATSGSGQASCQTGVDALAGRGCLTNLTLVPGRERALRAKPRDRSAPAKRRARERVATVSDVKPSVPSGSGAKEFDV